MPKQSFPLTSAELQEIADTERFDFTPQHFPERISRPAPIALIWIYLLESISLSKQYNGQGGPVCVEYDSLAEVEQDFQRGKFINVGNAFLCIRGRLYDWPCDEDDDTRTNPQVMFNQPVFDHIKYCMDMDEAFYDKST